MTDTVGKVQELLSGRLAELEVEKASISKALAAIDGPKARKRTAKAGATSKRSTKKTTKGRGRKPHRREQFVKLVEETPGITTSEVAGKMGIKANYLFRIANDLVSEGRLRKEGPRYHLVT